MFFFSPSTEARGASLCRWAWLMLKGQCFCGLMDAMGASYRYVPFFALHLHFLHFICSIFVGSGLNSMYMHARVFIGIGTILYAAPCKKLEQCLFLAAHSRLRHSLFRQACCFTPAPAGGHPSSSTRNRAGTGSAYSLVIWLAIWRTAERLHLAPTLFYCQDVGQ